MPNQVRAAIIGAGRIAELGHLPGYHRAGALVVALCGTDSEMLNRLGDAYQVEQRYTDWREMLSAGGFDAVSICTPPALHSEMTVACAQQGYHVLVEKPMAHTLAACDAMIDAAHSANTLLMVSHNQRFSNRHIIAKRIMVSGQLGRPYVAQAAFAHGGPENWSPRQNWYFDGRTTRLGVIADLGSHKIDLLRWLLGQEATEVSAFDSTFEKSTTVDDSALINLRFSGGTLATIYVSWTHRPGLADYITIQCEHGTLYVPTDASQPVRVVEQGSGQKVVETVYPFPTDDVPGWLGAVTAFVQAISEGKPSPVPGEDGKATMAAVLAAYDSVSSQSVIRLDT